MLVYISSVSRYRLKYCASCNTVVVNMGGGGGANFSVRITNLTLAPDLIDCLIDQIVKVSRSAHLYARVTTNILKR